MKTMFEILGQNIRESRALKGWSQEELSELANITPSHLGHIERGDGNPTLNTLLSICEALQIDIVDLVKEDSAAQIDNHGLDLAKLQKKFSELSSSRQREIYGILKTMISWNET